MKTSDSKDARFTGTVRDLVRAEEEKKKRKSPEVEYVPTLCSAICSNGMKTGG